MLAIASTCRQGKYALMWITFFCPCAAEYEELKPFLQLGYLWSILQKTDAQCLSTLSIRLLTRCLQGKTGNCEHKAKTLTSRCKHADFVQNRKEGKLDLIGPEVAADDDESLEHGEQASHPAAVVDQNQQPDR